MIPDVPYHYAPQTPLVKKISAVEGIFAGRPVLRRVRNSEARAIEAKGDRQQHGRLR